MAMQDGLIFIPDISGFTRFVTSTEQDHSQHIIAELLELLIDANQLDMTLAEIEGDALFYYKEGPLPSRAQLFEQMEQMFLQFHSHLKLYEQRRICQCGACVGASGLSLKFIVHSGPIEFIRIKNMRKPYGQEIITAHRLLKNNVPESEYALLTDAALAALPDEGEAKLLADWQPLSQEISFDEIGKVGYQYYQLEALGEHVEPPPPLPAVSKAASPIRISGTIGKEPDELFELITNLNFRHFWNKEAELEFDPKKLNRIGTHHKCIINGRSLNFHTVGQKPREGQWLYGEHTTDIPILREMSTYFILASTEQGTQLTIEAHAQMNPLLKWLLNPLIKRNIGKLIQKLFDQLKTAAEGTNIYQPQISSYEVA